MKGPEIRTGMLYTGKNTKIQLKDGQKFTLVNEDITGVGKSNFSLNSAIFRDFSDCSSQLP